MHVCIKSPEKDFQDLSDQLKMIVKIINGRFGGKLWAAKLEPAFKIRIRSIVKLVLEL